MKQPLTRENGQQRNTELTAFLEDGSELEGNMTFTGIVRINGKFKGTITSKDGLIIGQSAQILGNLSIGSANIGGLVEGEIHALERIEIQATARIKGTMSAPAIVVHEGAQILGDLRILREDEGAKSNPGLGQQQKKAAS